MALEHIDPYPWFLNKPLDLVVNEQIVRARISSSEWADSWRPFLARLYDYWAAQFPKRYLIAIAGPPGAGKSVFAEELHFIIDKGILHRDAHTVALPMDGFHFSNAYLQAHTRTLADGSEISLSAVKGQPDTIDVLRLRKYIQALIARPEYVPWPGYSRFSHDVVPEKFKVHQSINMVIIEGNYLLVNRGPFQGLPDMFNLRIYVDAPAPKIIANLVDRHIHAGKTLDDAKDWVKRVDLPNARLAESSRHQADVVIERDTDDDIASVTWKGEAPIASSKPSLPEVPVLPSLHPHHAPAHSHAPGESAPHPGDSHFPAVTAPPHPGPHLVPAAGHAPEPFSGSPPPPPPPPPAAPDPSAPQALPQNAPASPMP